MTQPSTQPMTTSEIVALATTLRELRTKVHADLSPMLTSGRSVLDPVYSSRSALWATLGAAYDAAHVVLDITRAEEDRSRAAAA